MQINFENSMRLSLRKITIACIVVGLLISFGNWYTRLNVNVADQQQKIKLVAKFTENDDLESVYNDRGKLEPTSSPLKLSTSMVESAGKFLDLLQNRRLSEYCNSPKAMVKGEEGNVPGNFELKSVLAVIRHGDRSPIRSIRNHPSYKLECKLDNKTISSNKMLEKYLLTLLQQKNISFENDFKDWDLYPDNDRCTGAQLTPTGVWQHIRNGRHFRHKYSGKLFTSSLSHKEVYIRSTTFTRTYQSALALLYGLMPNFDLSKLKFKKSSSFFFCSEHLSGLSCHCPVLHSLKQKCDSAIGEFHRTNSERKTLYRKLAEILAVKPVQLPWLTTIMDVLMSHVCHQIRLPCGKNNLCVDQYIMQTVWKILDEDNVLFKLQNQHYLTFSHLVSHPFLKEIVQHMKKVIQGNVGPKFLLYSGHDITIQPLVTLFGFFDGKWPSYASRLVIEFYKKKSHTGVHHFIRILYNGQEETKNVSFCKHSSVHGLCKFERFEHFVNTHLQQFGINSYTEACRTD